MCGRDREYMLKFAIVICSFTLSLFAQEPDTLYYFDFPDDSWIPAGFHWSDHDSYVECNLFEPGPDPFYWNTEGDTLSHDVLVIPPEIDSLAFVMNYDAEFILSAWGGYDTSIIVTATFANAVALESQVLWTQSATLLYPDSVAYYTSGPATFGMQYSGGGFQPVFSATIAAFSYYGSSNTWLNWEIHDLAIIGYQTNSLECNTWAGIKSAL